MKICKRLNYLEKGNVNFMKIYHLFHHHRKWIVCRWWMSYKILKSIIRIYCIVGFLAKIINKRKNYVHIPLMHLICKLVDLSKHLFLEKKQRTKKKRIRIYESFEFGAIFDCFKRYWRHYIFYKFDEYYIYIYHLFVFVFVSLV